MGYFNFIHTFPVIAMAQNGVIRKIIGFLGAIKIIAYYIPSECAADSFTCFSNAPMMRGIGTWWSGVFSIAS